MNPIIIKICDIKILKNMSEHFHSMNLNKAENVGMTVKLFEEISKTFGPYQKF